MLADPELRVFRVKNPMDPAFDAWRISAGDGDVLLNARIIPLETKALGIHGRVCELQLQDASFFALKSDKGHANSIRFRNMKSG